MSCWMDNDGEVQCIGQVVFEFVIFVTWIMDDNDDDKWFHGDKDSLIE